MDAAGVLIALEGIDGSGKGTQAKLLLDRCKAEGITCFTIGFPQYGKTPFAATISEYLNGVFGSVSEVHPKLVSILFAADRFASKELLQSALRGNALVICDRYVASNMAHQAAKLRESEREDFIRWLERVEYESFALPKADLTLLLDMPAEAAQRLVRQKSSREVGVSFSEGGQGGYTALKADIHEADLHYLQSCREVYRKLGQQNVGGKWITISCERDTEVRRAEEIADEIWQAVNALLHSAH